MYDNFSLVTNSKNNISSMYRQLYDNIRLLIFLEESWLLSFFISVFYVFFKLEYSRLENSW